MGVGSEGHALGWTGDPESDIPIMLLAKHVDGMHANEDMAFQTDFEDIHNARLMRRMGNAADAVDGGYNAVAASTFPDVVNGGSGKLSFRSAITIYDIR